ncbi:MAG: hypothetical protein KDA27_27230, partial [Candidatus Eisenbacteria bacterium]|nr:hypothetical protein [Candidatus Eisenbacteria bacterium]
MRPRSHRFRLAAALLMASAVSAACFVSVAPPVQAGPNAGGTLILHYGGDALGDGVCSFVNDPWCLDECWNSPEDCDSVIPAQPGDGWIHAMVFVLAAFPESSSPRLASVSFGVESPSPFEPYLDAWDPCPGTESPTENWPASGTGTTVTLAEVGTSSLVRIYAFAGYTEYGNPFEFVLTP